MNSSSSHSPIGVIIKKEPVDVDVISGSIVDNSVLSNGKSNDSSTDKATSSSIIPERLTMPALHKSVIVTAPPASVNNCESDQQLASSSAPTPPAMMGPGVIHGPLRLDDWNRLLLAMKQASALPQIMPSTTAFIQTPPPQQQQLLLPPPPLKRIIPVGNGGQTVIDVPPLIGGFNGQLLMRQSMDMNGHRGLPLTNGRSDEQLNLGASTTTVIVDDQESIDAQESKRKRRKRSKPNAIRKPTREEIRQARDARSPSTDEADLDLDESMYGDTDIIFDTALVSDQILSRQGAIVSPTRDLQAILPKLVAHPIPGQQTSPHSSSIVAQDQVPSTSRSQQEIDEHRLRRMRNNEAVRKSRMKARMKTKQSELNCRILVKQFGELKQKVQTLEKDLAWEKRKNEILEEMLRRTQMNAISQESATAATAAEDTPPS